MTPAKILAARKAAGLSQEGAARLLGVTLRTWQRWESGANQMSAPLWELFIIKTKPSK